MIADLLTLVALVWVMIVFGRMWLNTLPGAARRSLRGRGGGGLFVGVFFKLLDLSVLLVGWVFRAILGPLLRLAGRGVARGMNSAAERIAQNNSPHADRLAWFAANINKRSSVDRLHEPVGPDGESLEDMQRRVANLHRSIREGQHEAPNSGARSVDEIAHESELRRALVNILGVFGENSDASAQLLRGSTITPADVDQAEEFLGAAYAVSWVPGDEEDSRPGLLIERALYDDDAPSPGA